ncbi:unnamed protein product [Rotaria sp. Silwood1]|nr:unnamed protein product [Rotaria sp. Silwood1]CAF4903230.1 unnamed protein product [Rotaria sp. Silwood1]
MNRRFRCGRLALTRDGIIKKIELEDGGGSRFCKWDPIDIDFETIHRNLIEIFKLGEYKLKTSLYDFRRNPLDINQYNTFFEYVNKNGLNCSSTIIYLCTHQADDNDNQPIMLNKKKETFSANLSSSMSNSLILQQKKSILTETTSLITSMDNKYVNKFQNECNQKQQINQLSTYSFEKSINDLIDTIRNLINQNAFDLVLIELFKHICMIKGYVCSIINTLNQKIDHIIQNYQLINQSEIKLYSKTLNEISNICQSVEILINLNKKKFDHIQQFPIIINLFFEFYENLKILYNNWFEHVEKNNNNNKYNTLSSSLIRPNESISSNSNIKSSSEYSNEINVENFKEQLPASSNKSERLLSIRKLFDDEAGTKFLLFRQLLTRFNDLSRLLKKHNLSSYYQMVELTTSKIKYIRSHIDLSNGLSILKARNDILLIRAEYREKFNHKYLQRNKYKVGQDVKQFYICLMKTIHNVSRRLHRLRMHVENKKKNFNPHSSISVMNHVAWISIYNPTSTVCYLKRNIIVGVAVSPHITSAVTTTAQAKAKTNPHKLVDTNPTSSTTSSTDDQPQKVVGHAFDISIISEAQKGDKLYQEKVLELKSGQTNCSYILNHGILYKLFKHNTFIQKLIYVPSTILSELLKVYHVAPWAGHFDFRSTYFKLKHKYWWPDMKTTIKNYIQSCSKCQDFNASRHQTDLSSEKPKAIYTFDKSNDYFPHFTRTLSNYYQNSQTNMDQRQTYNRIFDRNRVNMYCNVGTQELKRLSHSSSKPSPIYSRPMIIIKQQHPTQ